jgi:hypothetical protein
MFNTKLSPKDEAKFQSWAKDNGKNPDMESIDYDLRGMYADSAKFAGNGHGTDKFKKPNHPTFSDQSKYHNSSDGEGGMYVGGKWGGEGDQFTYTPSKEMMLKTHNPDDMVDYIRKNEKTTNLILPITEEE